MVGTQGTQLQYVLTSLQVSHLLVAVEQQQST